MSTASTHPLVNEYLRKIKKDSAFLTRSQQQELLNDLREHIDSALTGNESDDQVRAVLVALGSTEDVLAPYATTKMPQGGRLTLAFGIAALITLLAPPYSERRYGLTSLAFAALAITSALLLLRRSTSVVIARRRSYLALTFSLVALLTVGVIQAAFIPDPSGGVQISATTPGDDGQTAKPYYAVGEKCSESDLTVRLKDLPEEGQLPEVALLTLGNTSARLCSIEGPLSIRVGQANGEEVTGFVQDCWRVPLQDRCVAGTLKTNADFKDVLERPTGYVAFLIKGANSSGGTSCSPSTAPRYFRIVAAGIDLKLPNRGSRPSTCTGSVEVHPYVTS